jgi:hypothetical protein
MAQSTDKTNLSHCGFELMDKLASDRIGIKSSQGEFHSRKQTIRQRHLHEPSNHAFMRNLFVRISTEPRRSKKDMVKLL